MKAKIILLNVCVFCAFVKIYSQEHDTLWTKIYGDNNQCTGSSMMATGDGFLIVGSIKKSNTVEWDFWIVKINEKGDTLWTRTIAFGLWDGTKKIIKCKDGNYLLYGSTGQSNNYHMAAAKIKSNGDTLWTRSYPYTADEKVQDIIETDDEGFIMISKTLANNYDRIRFVKIDKNGKLITEKLFGTNNYNSGNSIVRSFDNKFLIAGYTKTSSSAKGKIMILKVDDAGSLLDTKTYTAPSEEVEAFQIIQTLDSCYMLCSQQRPNMIKTHYYLYVNKLDKSLTEVWNKTLNFSKIDNNYNQPAALISTPDSGFVITGATGNQSLKDFMLIKLNAMGEIEWRDSIATSVIEEGTGVVQLNKDEFFVIGNTQLKNTNRAWLLKYGVSIVGIQMNNSYSSGIFGYPNPTNNFFNIQYTLNNESDVTFLIKDITGKEIKSVRNGKMNIGKYIQTFDFSDLPNGIYFYQLKTEKLIVTKPVQVIK